MVEEEEMQMNLCLDHKTIMFEVKVFCDFQWHHYKQPQKFHELKIIQLKQTQSNKKWINQTQSIPITLRK
jgi:hypothetical protein